MNNRGKRNIIVSIFISALLLFGAVPAYATTDTEQVTDESSESGGFSYEIIQPENQIDDSVSYFNLRMTPGQVQTVHINFTNTGTEDAAMDISLDGGKTNQNGVIEYGLNSLENDDSLRYPFEEVVTGPSEITVPAGETVPLELTITMPEEEFDGMIAGGIRFQPHEDEDEDAEGIVQNFSYVVGMVLSENDNPVEAQLELNDVYAQLNNYRGAIYVNFSNITPIFINNVTVNASIFSADDLENVAYEGRTTGMRMAPNSFLNYPVGMGGNSYTPGDYQAVVDVYATEGEWHWTYDFTITEELANELNEQNINVVQERGFNWWLIIGIALGILLLIVLVYIIIHYKNKNKKQKRR